MDTSGQERPAHDPALRMLLNGFVTMYWRRELLDAAVAELRAAGYAIVGLDASGWAEPGDMHRDIAAAFDFPDYYGRNLDALNDCLHDHLAAPPGAEGDAGLVLVFTGYDRFAHACPRPAHVVLDIVADVARRRLLSGERVLCLVQTDDPDLRFEPVGATPVEWNAAEWLDATRHP